MKKTVFLALILSLCLLVTFVSCTDDQGNTADTTAAVDEVTEAPTEEVTTGGDEVPTGPIGDDEEGTYNGIHRA